MFYEALRGSRDRAARFFQFILDYVAHADDLSTVLSDPEQLPHLAG